MQVSSQIMVVHVSRTPEKVGTAVGELIVKLSKEAIAANGRFTLALSGGSLPRVSTVYKHLLLLLLLLTGLLCSTRS